jgi:Universal stress protein UspA and related nucleotide-binding proteins
MSTALLPTATVAVPTVLNRRRARIANILLATDFSPVSDGATDQAVDLCRSLGARLLVVNVIDPRLGLGGQETSSRAARLDQLRSDRERRLLVIVERARGDGVEATFLVWTGEPGQSIVSAAEAESANLVVVGTRALERAHRFLLGSVSEYVVNHSPCPVLIAR